MAHMMFRLISQLYIWIDFTRLDQDQQDKVARLLCVVSVGLAPRLACVTTNVYSIFAITTLRICIVRN